MKLWKKMAGILLLICSMVLTNFYVVKADAEHSETKKDVNRYNIIFVNDESGSMNSTDKEKNRYEAIQRFVFLMAQEGNRVGSISFNERIKDQQDMMDIETFSDKKNFVDHLSQFYPEGNKGRTNIGLALKTAVDMLKTDGDKELPSIIILLTDGETQMGNEEEKEKSLEQKAEAIEDARKSGIKIYSVCLGNSGAQKAEMQQIANATDGEFVVVNNASGLHDAEEMFYKIIFNAVDGDTIETTIGDDGKVVQDFFVSNLGIEELNIIIEGEMSDCTLKNPDGKLYSASELNDIMLIGNNYRLIKVVEPIGGIWTVTVHGEPGVKIKFKPLCNSSLSMTTTVTEPKELKAGSEIIFHTVLKDKKGTVENLDKYEGLKATLVVSSKGEENTYSMTPGEDAFTYSYKIEESGSFYMYVTVESNGITLTSETYGFDVDNSAPVPVKEIVEKTVKIWPFIGGNAKVDLTGMVKDADGDAITYSIESTAFNEDDYVLKNNTLTVEKFSIKKGSFKVRATDVNGAYCTFDVLFNSINIGVVMALTILIGGFLILVLLIVVAWQISKRHFNGDVLIEVVRDGRVVQSDRKEGYELQRGNCSISFWDVEGIDEFLPKRSVIQPGKKKDKCIYLVTKTPVYNEFGTKAKKHKIRSMSGGVLFNQESGSLSGIRIDYECESDKF